MENKFLNWLIESPKVYYIYNRGSIIYGINNSESDIDFLVIVDNDFEFPEDFEEYKYQGWGHRKFKYNVLCDNCDFIFYSTEEWFNKVTSGNIEAWECACLPKKFIHKEHVKLLMSTNPLQLRKDFEEWMNLDYLVADQYFRKEQYSKWKKELWRIINRVKLINQIIDNHKIVNFKIAISDYLLLVENNTVDEKIILKSWLDLISPEIEKLNKSTDGMLKKEREKKIIQNEK